MVTLAPIVLGSKPPVLPGTIILKAPPGRAQRFLELQPKIFPFLAGTVATIFGGPITGVKVFAGTGLASGILVSSARARKLVKEKILDPTAIGVGIGSIIEDPGQLIPKDTTPAGVGVKVKEVLLSAGLIGGTAAAVVGGVALGKAALAKFPKPSLPRARETAKEPQLAILPAPPSITPTTQPLGAVQQPVTEKPIVQAQPPINITNTFNPSIKISFKKSRKFINQQLLIR